AVKPGAVATFQISFNTNGGNQSGGFLVFHDTNPVSGTGGNNTSNQQGTLGIVDSREHACPDGGTGPGPTTCPGVTNSNTEVMHSFPQAFVPTANFEFTYSAPFVCSGTFFFDF